MSTYKRLLCFLLATITTLNLLSVGLIDSEASQSEYVSEEEAEEPISFFGKNSVPVFFHESPELFDGKQAKQAWLDSLQPDETYPTILGFDSPAYEVYLENQITISFTCQTTETFGNYTLSCSDPNAVTIGEIRETIRSSVSGPATYIVSADIVALNAGEYTITAEVEINGIERMISVPLRVSTRPKSRFVCDSYTAQVGETQALTFTYHSDEEWDSITWTCSDPDAVRFSEGTSTVPPGEVGGTGEENTWWMSNMVTAVRGGSYTITAEVHSGEKTHTVQTRLHVNETVYSGVLDQPKKPLKTGDRVTIDDTIYEIAPQCKLCDVYESSVPYGVKDVLYSLDADGRIVTLYPADRIIEPRFTVEGKPVSFSYRNGKWNATQLEVTVSLEWISTKECPFTMASLENSDLDIPLSEIFLSTDSDAIHFGIEGTLFKKELHEYIAENVIVSVGRKRSYTCTVYMREGYKLDSITQTAQLNTHVKTRWGVEYNGTPLQIVFGNLDLQQQEVQKKQENKQYSASLKKAKEQLKSLNIGLSGPLMHVLTPAQYDELEGFLSIYLMESIMAEQLLQGTFFEKISKEAEKKIGDAVLDKLNISRVKNWLSVQNNNATVKVEAVTKSGENIRINFELDWQSYSWGEKDPSEGGGRNDPYGAYISIHYSVEGSLPDGMGTTGSGLAGFYEMEKFGEAMLDYIEEAYDEAWGEDANKVASMLISEPVYKMLGGDFSGGLYKMMKGAAQQHVKVNRIKCPVDVYIYDIDGNLCGSIVNDYVNTQDSSVVAYVNGTEKVIYLMDETYRLELVGNGDGEMAYTVEEYLDNQLTRTLEVEKIFLMEGKRYYAIIPDTPLLHGEVYALTDDNGWVTGLRDSLDIKDPAGSAEVYVVESRSCGANATYTLYSNGLLVISGTGPIDTDGEPYYRWRDAKYLVIEEGITQIDEYAFYSTDLIYVELPDSVTEIGRWAFGYCSDLRYISFGSGLTTIGLYAFSYCYSLNTIKVKENNAAFQSIDGVLFSKDGTILYLMPKAAPRSAPTVYTVPTGVTTIGVDAIGDNSYLTRIILPESVTMLSDEAFNGASTLEVLEIYGNITSIGSSVMYGCSNVKHMYFGPNVSEVHVNLFSNLGDCTIEVAPENPYLFADQASVLYRTDPAELILVTSQLEGIYRVVEQTERIYSGAFYGQSALTEVIFPDSLKVIEDSAFKNCKVLQQVSFGAAVQTIGDRAFEDCTSLSRANFEPSIRTIGEYAFYNCSALTELAFPDGLEDIGSYAFSGCSMLERVTIPESVNEMGMHVFADTALTSAGPSGSGCDLEYDWKTSFPSWTFYGDNTLKQILLPDELTAIPWAAFDSCTALEELTIPDGVVSIGSRAFSGCTSLLRLTIPATATDLGSSILYGCVFKSAGPIGSGQQLEFGWTDAIPEDAFEYMYGLESVILPVGLRRIERDAFNSCISLTSISFPDQLKSIDYLAFKGCTGLKDVYFKGLPPYIEGNAFSGVTANAYYPESLSHLWASETGSYGGTLTWYPYKADAPLVLVSEPEDAYGYIGKTASFSVVVANTDAVYQWYESADQENWKPCTYGTGNAAAFTFTVLPEHMNHYYRCVVTGSDGEMLQTDAVQLICETNPIAVNTRVQLDTSASVLGKNLVFAPTQSGEYFFAFSYTDQCLGRLYDAQGKLLAQWNPQATRAGTSHFVCQLDANETYYLYTECNRAAYVTLTSNVPIPMPFNTQMEVILFNNLADYNLLIIPEATAEYIIRFEDAEYCYYSLTDADGNVVSESGSFRQDTYEATCELEGGKEYILTLNRSGIKYGDAFFVTLTSGHNYTCTVYRTPSCEVSGRSVYTCLDCGYTVTKNAPATGHNYVNGVCVNCTSGIISQGQCGEQLYWELHSTGVLRIFGTGKMDNYSYTEGFWESAPWYPFPEEITTVTLNYGITEIGNYAFYLQSMDSVDIPESVKRIGVGAWQESSVGEIRFLGDAPNIHMSAFTGCTIDAYYDASNPTWTAEKMQNYGGEVTWIPSEFEMTSGACGSNLWWSVRNGVLIISGSGDMYDFKYPFSEDDEDKDVPIVPWYEYSSEIYTIRMDEGITSIGDYAFMFLENVSEIALPSALTSIGSHSLYGLNITEIHIHEGVVDIGEYAFGNCHELTDVYFPRTLRSVGNAAFYQDDSIERVYIPDLESWFQIRFTTFFSTPFSNYGDTLLYVNHVPMTDIVVPASVTQIGAAQFNNYSALTSISFHDKVTCIGEDAFNCDGGAELLTSVIVPASVEYIGSRAFANCSHLSDLYIMNPTCEIGEDICFDSNCYFDEELDEMIYGMTTIHGYAGSTAEEYAQEFYHPFVELIPYMDVEYGSFYYDSVMWAIEAGVTNGTSATTFGPNDQCMRAHVVTFLWRALGCPEPTRTENPFVDVKPSDFYYKPVLWALENGITAGLDATHFGPAVYCNRAQVVTFLYRTMESPDVAASTNPFADVATGSFYEQPVLWAVENDITNGLSATIFGPNNICNRAQIVTFLYRAFEA